jgi:hypothetical protein
MNAPKRAGGHARPGEHAVREFLRRRGAPERVVRGGVEGLVTEWERIAASVVGGYPLDTLEDYLNDMDVRQLIADVAAALREASHGATDARIAAADARVRAALVPAGRCLWGAASARQHGWSAEREWWYFMQPASPGAGLRADLAGREEA